MITISKTKKASETSRKMKNQRNIIPPKDYNNLPGTHPKDIEISDLPVKEFMIAILWKLNEL